MGKVSPKKIVRKLEKKKVKKSISLTKKISKVSKTISSKKSSIKKTKLEKRPAKKLVKKLAKKKILKPNKTRKSLKKKKEVQLLPPVDLRITEIFAEPEAEQQLVTSDYFESIPSPLTSRPLVEMSPSSDTQTAVIEHVEITTIEEPDTFETMALAPNPTYFEYDRLIEIALKPYDTPVLEPHILKRIAQRFLKIFTTFARKLPESREGMI